MRRRSRLDTIRESLRLQQIYNVILRYGMDMLLDRGMIGEFRRFMQEKVYEPPQPVVPLSIPVKARLMMQELGPTYVKMGQLISSQSTVIPEEWERELVKLQNNVPPFALEDVRQTIIEELGAPPEELFATFVKEPMAAASTAQVHRATLPDDTEVVIKVQRPNIKKQVTADLGIMQNLSKVMMRRSDWARQIDLAGVLTEFGENILLELDYTGEIYNTQRLSRNLADIEGVHLPVIYPQYSTSKIITMEFINGVKISNVSAIDKAGLDKDKLAQVCLRGTIKQLLIDGFFHADPHPGNLLVSLDTGEVNFIDTGMVGELDFQKRVNLINLLLTLNERDTQGIAQVMLSLSKPFREVDEKAYYRDFERRVGAYMEFGSNAMSDSVNVVFDVLQNHGLRLDAQLTLAIKALMQAEAISKVLSPDSGVVESATQMIQGMVLDEINADNITKVVKNQVNMTLREFSKRMPNLQEATLKWLDQYQKGRFEVFVDTSDLSKTLEKSRRTGVLAIVGLMVAGMIVGSAIAATAPQVSANYWSYMPRLALTGYTLAMLVAFGMIFGLLWWLWKGSKN